ncbi:MAG: phytanoyl-CoA dioxygenase family protein, partial [Alphaproteobacteria bacterium]|nr:phytanoyl-CoA dioxygenase family protein [Alphaproteobacteria bacterium]
MLHTPTLSDEQRSDFERDGFVVVRAAFDGDEMRQIEGWTRELAALPEAPDKHWVYHESSLLEPSKELISRIEKISAFHLGFAELSTALAAPVGQL